MVNLYSLTTQSFCLSLVYLFTTLFLALYSTLSTKCIFWSSPFNPIQKPLFSYPPTYGEHKYAIPTVRSACTSPVFFSDYSTVLKDIKEICQNSSPSTSTMSYLPKKADSFAGNFSTKERISYFDHRDDQVKVPCGFMKEFPVSDSDRIAMESYKEVVVVSAIFGDSDKIRQPRGLGSESLETVCFIMFIDDLTLKGLHSHNLLLKEGQELKLGVWRIVRVVSSELPYKNPAMNGVIPKHLVHRLFPNSIFSIWLDAKLQLMVDPLLLIHSLVISENVDMAISKHSYYIHTVEEAMATARWKKWGNVDSLKEQMEVYCENGLKPWTSHKLPYTTDVPDSALILRRHGVGSNLFSCLLFNELEAFNPRDQLAFAYVRDNMNPKIKLNMFEVQVFEQIVREYRHNLKHGGGSPAELLRTKWDLCINGSSCTCSNYLLEMWRESRD